MTDILELGDQLNVGWAVLRPPRICSKRTRQLKTLSVPSLLSHRQLLKRLNELIKDALRNPFVGLGKPEPLKGDWSGYWSRRINTEHRSVYSVSEAELTIISCWYHYQE